MKDRIRQIMESQHMTQQVFAEFIGLAPATLSSIYNERTRPTLGVVEAIKKKIPDINTDWLMFGTGDMYGHTPEPHSDVSSAGSEGRQQPQSPMIDFDQPLTPTPQPVALQPRYPNSVKNTPLDSYREEVKYVDKPQRRITEIRVFYDDQTFDTFTPTKK